MNMQYKQQTVLHTSIEARGKSKRKHEEEPLDTYRKDKKQKKDWSKDRQRKRSYMEVE
jgi:hypothetical protein